MRTLLLPLSARMMLPDVFESLSAARKELKLQPTAYAQLLEWNPEAKVDTTPTHSPMQWISNNLEPQKKLPSATALTNGEGHSKCEAMHTTNNELTNCILKSYPRPTNIPRRHIDGHPCFVDCAWKKPRARASGTVQGQGTRHAVPPAPTTVSWAQSKSGKGACAGVDE